MAFASNTAAFGMKPATSIFGQPPQPPQQTATANAPLGQQQQQGSGGFSLFGQNNQQQQPTQPTTNVFGQPQQQQQTGAAGTFGQPQQNTTTGTSGLFGQPQQNTAAGATGIFGQPQQQSTTTGSTGLFGQPAQQNTNTGTTSLFGQPAQQNTNTGTTGLFGQPTQQNTSTGLFGQPQQQNTTSTSNIFGQPSQQNNTGTIGLFGQPQQQQNATGGLFGQSTTQPQQGANIFGGGSSTFGGSANTGSNLFGSSVFGAKPAQPQQYTGFGNSTTQPSTAQLQFSNGVPPFTKSTKFNDLSDDYKKVMENIDSYIQGRVQISKDLQQRKLGDEPIKGHDAIRQLNKELINTATTIRDDLHLTNDLKAKVGQAVEDTIVATRIIDGFRNPQSGNTYLKDHAAFPLEYFTRVTEQMKERLNWYQSTIEQIERKLASASNSTQTPQSISATLQAQHQIFLALASKTATVDAELQKIKSLYTQLWRSKTGSVRDPFNDGSKPSNADTAGDFGLGSLNFR